MKQVKRRPETNRKCINLKSHQKARLSFVLKWQRFFLCVMCYYFSLHQLNIAIKIIYKAFPCLTNIMLKIYSSKFYFFNFFFYFGKLIFVCLGKYICQHLIFKFYVCSLQINIRFKLPPFL